MDTPTQCGVSGKKFAEGDLYVEQVVPAEGESDAYTRFIAAEHTGLSEDEIQAGLEAGTVKRFVPQEVV